MSINRKSREWLRGATVRLDVLALAAAVAVTPTCGAWAQTDEPGAEQPSATVVSGDESALSSSSLPEAPEISGAAASGLMQTGLGIKPAPPTAGPYTKYILPGQTAPHLSAGDKFVLGVRDAVSPLAAVGWVAAAGYEQATNGSPNYGQTGKGFAQRLGASAARASSEGIFSDSILSPILHEDPRYYKMGSGHNFFKRLVYAGTRPLITRSDGGREVPNLALLGGNLAGAALTQAYYPPLNRGFSQVLQTFGGSIGGSALGDVVSEFLADTVHALHKSQGR